MNPMATSKEEILRVCRESIRQQGWDALNIRAVAKACGVSVGTIYNYFRSKDDLIAASVESVWHDIFHHEEDMSAFADILSCIRWLYQRLQYGGEQYPNFFNLHALRFEKDSKLHGREQMLRTWEHIRQSLITVILNDPHIHSDAFQGALTPDAFVNVIFAQMLLAMLRQDYEPSALLEICRKVLY